MEWLVPIWTWVVALVCVALAMGWAKWPVRSLAGVLAVGALIPWLPSSHAVSPRKPSTQIVYRFDEHRYLELVGYGCEGAINYVDKKRGIHTAMIEQFARVFLPPITHADNDGDFIFLPYSDIAAFRVSKDHGKTFVDARWVGTREFGPEDVKKITIVHQQAFIQLIDGRLFMTSKPFGKGWGTLVIDPVNHLPESRLAERPEFQGLPATAPDVENYQGWTGMRCDPDLEGPPKETLGTIWNGFQAKVLTLLGSTVAWPAAWLARTLV
jgi:hypothetical protein